MRLPVCLALLAVVVGREAHHRGDVVYVGAAGDQRGAPVDHRVVNLARFLVVGVLRPDHPAP